jgi:D-lactate dehydrogenase (cytochrome)
MEWLDSECLKLVRPSHGIHNHYGSLYIEQEYPTDEIREASLHGWYTFLEEISEQFHSKIHTEVAVDARSLRNMKSERARIPEMLNEMIEPGMVKIGTDFSVPFEHLGELLGLYKKNLPKGNSFVFGHIGNAHLHANILARNSREQIAYFKIVEDLASEVISLGGNISGEHGIGKLKREAFKKMIGENGVDQLRRIKGILDPKCILNRGNLFFS